MSENKYQPPVNMPENIPGPDSVMVQFLSTKGNWMAFDRRDLILCQKDDNTVTIAAHVGDKLLHFLEYSGVKLVPIIEEKAVVVP